MPNIFPQKRRVSRMNHRLSLLVNGGFLSENEAHRLMQDM
ncbi:anthranilate phosphoribosyltransferase, partial [Bacillus pumilus]